MKPVINYVRKRIADFITIYIIDVEELGLTKAKKREIGNKTAEYLKDLLVEAVSESAAKIAKDKNKQ